MHYYPIYDIVLTGKESEAVMRIKSEREKENDRKMEEFAVLINPRRIWVPTVPIATRIKLLKENNGGK